jgi:KaiC/GvpD/RAD55 family RecA-like ATPase
VPEYAQILGIPEIDEPIGTATSPGWLAVLSGTSGSGAPLLAKQFAHAGVGSVPVLFYTTYERSEDVKKAFDDFGWDPASIKIVNLADEYYERVLLRGLEVASARERGLNADQLVESPSRERIARSFSLTNRMLADLAAIDSPFRLVVDSVDFFFEVLQPNEVTTVARQIRHRCQTIGGQALLTAHSLGHERSVFGLLEDLADLSFHLEAVPQGAKYEHTLYIQKVGNRPDLARIVKVEVGENGWRTG